MGAAPGKEDYTRIRQALRDGDVESMVVIVAENKIRGQFRAKGADDPGLFQTVVPTDDLVTAILQDVDEYNQANPDVAVAVEVQPRASAYLIALIQIFPWLLIGGVIIWMVVRHQKNMSGAGGNAFGKSRARLASPGGKVTFADVAGVEEAKDEVFEVIEFLRDPDRFRKLGGHIPKGVMLVGSPGTGKTLLARAVAGEAGVPFFSISGSDFVEMFVGVGASRVRDLFRQAREHAPCIVFLDEIDAVGRRRGATAAGGSEEREQTLNAILVEMDGFDSDSGVIVMAASNRPDVLDPALMRPGRFDREITVDLADMKGRLAILKVHSREVPLGAEVELEQVARGTPGFSGADLAALVNEAALIAALESADAVLLEHLEEARDKVRWGRAKKSRVMEEDDRRVTAYHEAGHAILAHLIPEVEPLHKVTIIPRGMSLGSTMQLPLRDQYHLSRTQAFGNLMVLLGGRIAEEAFCEDVCSGASNDLERVSDLARRMVCNWGMSENLGPIVFSDPTAMPGENNPGIEAMSEETRQAIDREIRDLVAEAYERATLLIEEHREDVDAIAMALLEEETLNGEEVQELIELGAAVA